MSLYVYGRYQLVHHRTEPTDTPSGEVNRRVDALADDYAKEAHYADTIEKVVSEVAMHVDAMRALVPAGTDPHDDSYYSSFVNTVRANTDLHAASVVAPDGSVWWWLKLV